MRVQFPVQGMTCAMCSGRLERALKKQLGVISAQVNLATEQARVDYDPQQTSLAQLCQAVSASGYQVATQTMSWAAPADRLAEVQQLPGVLNAHWDKNLEVEFVAHPALVRQLDGLLGVHSGGGRGSPPALETLVDLDFDRPVAVCHDPGSAVVVGHVDSVWTGSGFLS
jgi:cation transport ATPase